MKQSVQRNGLVDIMRLLFAGIVMMHHFYFDGKHFAGGRLGVEFFAILAGALLISAWDRNRISELSVDQRQHYWLSYMGKRYAKFFWYCLGAFVFAFFLVRILHDKVRGIASICDVLSVDIWEILLVKMFGLNQGGWGVINGPTWTMGCMLLSEFFILGMLTFWKRQCITLLIPLSLICGTGYWMNMESADYRKFLAFTTFGVLRVYLMTCAGILAYFIAKRLKKIPFSRVGRGVLTVVELLGFTFCVWIVVFRVSLYYQFCFMLIATLTLAVSFSGKSFAGNMFPANAFTNFCAEFSLSLYLTHFVVLQGFRYAYTDINHLYRQKFVFLCCALVVALAYTYIMRGVFKMLPIMKEKLKSVMLEQS